MTTYTNKSNAVRAAKREFGEGNFEVKASGDGLWAYIRSGALDADAAPALTNEEKAIVDNSVVVSATDDGALVGEAEDGTLTTIAPATKTEASTSFGDLGDGMLDSLLAAFHASDTRDDAFMRGLFRAAIQHGIDNKPAKTKAPRDGGPTLREQAAALLTQKGGTTSKAILELTKWPSVSVPALAKASKLDLRKDKVDGVTRYYGTAQKAA
ncbi:hypothetical protein [Mesorhizobium sp. GbtcB19]|uniref:hypothetical protein n=1 Tax=Mesorhizobium sp. GbtcB19 TaxID=2824764 RepID=UPI001C2F87D5|nr:hypothetical protein [Mesorhizobium sp. GbtcB19]